MLELPTKAQALRASEFLRARVNREIRSPRTISDLTAHYQAHELPKKTPYTQQVYLSSLDTWILPRWGNEALHQVCGAHVEDWLGSLTLANGTKAKLRNVMSALYQHAIRYKFAQDNPLHSVRQSAKREREPDVLTSAELGALLIELAEPWRTAVYVAAVTGLRVSELLALRWSDFDFAAGKINLSRGIVRQVVGTMKTEESRKPLPLNPELAEVLMQWRSVCPFNQPASYVFASPAMDGKQPYWANTALEKHIKPAAVRAQITGKRVGWHTLRHSFATLVHSQGADVATMKALMRHSNANVTLDIYAKAITSAKREAQSRVANSLVFPNVPAQNTVEAAKRMNVQDLGA